VTLLRWSSSTPYTEDMATVPGSVGQAISPTVKLSGKGGVDLAVEPRFSLTL
jgi:hypothetical protein